MDGKDDRGINEVEPETKIVEGRMNIALVTTSFLPMVGGLEWKVHFLACEYINRGHQVTVFAGPLRKKHVTHTVNVKQPYEVVRYGYPIRGFRPSGLERLLFLRTFLKSHKKKAFDVIHSHHFGAATAYAVQVKKKTAIPVVATTTGGDVQVMEDYDYGARRKPMFDRFVRENLKWVDRVASVNRNIKQNLLEINPSANVEVIPNGVNWPAFQGGPSDYLKRKFDLKESAKIILSMGRNHPIKGYSYGIEAFSRVANKTENVYYFIVGRWLESLKPVINRLEMEDRVLLLDQQPMDRVPDIFKSADIFFNPSLSEGFSQVNAQALASGLPCVVTDAPGNVDAADFGGALIARTQDPQDMSEKLLSLIENDAFRNETAAQALEAGKHYAWKGLASKYVEIFQELLKK